MDIDLGCFFFLVPLFLRYLFKDVISEKCLELFFF